MRGSPNQRCRLEFLTCRFSTISPAKRESKRVALYDRKTLYIAGKRRFVRRADAIARALIGSEELIKS